MFCSSCGKGIEEATFCAGCGMPQKSSETTKIATRKINKKVVFGIVAALAVVIAAVMFFSNRGELSGTWVDSSQSDEFPITISFRGNNFTTVHYRGYSRSAMQRGIELLVTPSPPWYIHRVDESAIERQLVPSDLDFFAEWRWEYGVVQRITARGTYSLNDDRLELLFSDGTIEILNIRRTENTLDIRGRHRSAFFVRR